MKDSYKSQEEPKVRSLRILCHLETTIDREDMATLAAEDQDFASFLGWHVPSIEMERWNQGGGRNNGKLAKRRDSNWLLR